MNPVIIMNSLELLYETEDLLTDEGVQAICEKIHGLDVSHMHFYIDRNHRIFNFKYPYCSWISTRNWTNCWAAKKKLNIK